MNESKTRRFDIMVSFEFSADHFDEVVRDALENVPSLPNDEMTPHLALSAQIGSALDLINAYSGEGPTPTRNGAIIDVPLLADGVSAELDLGDEGRITFHITEATK